MCEYQHTYVCIHVRYARDRPRRWCYGYIFEIFFRRASRRGGRSISITPAGPLSPSSFHQKIPVPRIDNLPVDTRIFFPPPINLFFTFPHVRKRFGSLEGDFAFPNDRKAFRSPEGMRCFKFPHARKFWSQEPGQVFLEGPDFYGREQCSGSITFWCGSGSADPCL